MQLYIFFLFCLILKHSQAWYFVGISPAVEFLFYFLILGAGVVANKGIRVRLKTHHRVLLLVILACSLFSCRGIIGLSVFAIINVLLVAQLLQLDEINKRKAFSTLNKWIWILTILSLLFFLLAKVGLPSFGTVSWRQYPANNFLFYFEDIRINARFNGFTLEPGYMGILMAVMLVVNRFKMNKYSLTYLIALAFTMSLGGWFITSTAFIAQYCISNYRQNKKRVVGLALISVLAMATLTYVATTWNTGDNVLNEWVFSRLDYDEEKGVAGNTRAAKWDQELAFLSFLNSNDVYLGMGDLAYSKLTNEDDDWAGYTTFIMRYGIIPMILLFLASFYYVKSLHNIRFFLPAALVWLLDWWQHSGLFPPVLVMMFLFFELYSKPASTKKQLIRRVKSNNNEFVSKS